MTNKQTRLLWPGRKRVKNLTGLSRKPKSRDGKVGSRGYLVPKRLVNIRSQLSSPPLPLQLHGSRRRAQPDAATSVWKTRPRRGHRQQLSPCPPRPSARPLLQGCDLRSPRAAAHLHLTRPQAILQGQQGPIYPVEKLRLSLRSPAARATEKCELGKLRAGRPASGSLNPGFELSRPHIDAGALTLSGRRRNGG